MSDLILVPTSLELEPLRRQLSDTAADSSEAGEGIFFQRIGFGPIAAAARTGALVARYRPSRVLLLGIAGSFDVQRFPVGTACRFDRVICDGIGVGQSDQFQSAEDIGWKQFAARDAMPEVSDAIALVATFDPRVPCAGTLLSVCAGSANSQDRDARAARYPSAVAEDMEGFAVAVACTLAGVPLQIIRGISNEVGDREKANWRIDDALRATAEMAKQVLDHAWMPTV
ncbi:futalosine hydrolase [Rubripirellula amarantea]|uniref:futalosine hydrolase n=1 Tax=Rubripirellula amarantea TaxID=2527999 RepID=UPI0013EF00EA|nr:futalosine hydrolase [Rubripirellula amarantea]